MAPRAFHKMIYIIKAIQDDALTGNDGIAFTWPDNVEAGFLQKYDISVEEYGILAGHLRPRPNEFDPARRRPTIGVDYMVAQQSSSPKKKRKADTDFDQPPIPFRLTPTTPPKPTTGAAADSQTIVKLQKELDDLRTATLPHIMRSAFHLGVRMAPADDEDLYDQYYSRLLSIAITVSQQLTTDMEAAQKKTKKARNSENYMAVIKRPGNEKLLESDYYINSVMKDEGYSSE